MIDPISEELETATALKHEVTVFVDHNDKDDFVDKLKQFKQSIADNVTLDYGDSRENMKKLIKEAMEILPDVAIAVTETRSDKAIMALSQFLKTVGELNKDLVKMNTDAMNDKNAIGISDVKSAQGNNQHIDQQINNQIVVVNKTEDIMDVINKEINERRFCKEPKESDGCEE